MATDFGSGPYVGQLRMVAAGLAPALPVIELISDLPQFRPDLAGFLLARLRRGMPPLSLYCCVVDPGVGSERDVLVAQVGADWFVGPDNGLLAPLLADATDAKIFRVLWRPGRLSSSFHGRDLFLPLAARLAAGELPAAEPMCRSEIVGSDWPSELARVCYVDVYGNLVTGLSAERMSLDASIRLGPTLVSNARTFSDVGLGRAFWYRNAFDLIEVAVNQGRADERLGVRLGDEVEVVAPGY